MKVKETMTWETALTEACQNKIDYWKKSYPTDTFEKPLKKVSKKVIPGQSCVSKIKNLIKKLKK